MAPSRSSATRSSPMLHCALVCGDCAQVCQAEAREIVGRRVTVAEVMAEVEKDIVFYDESGGGVTFSGGEPLMQPDFLRALLQSCKEKEIRTAVDTSGLAAWKTLQSVSENVDLFLYDLKLMDDEKHRRVYGRVQRADPVQLAGACVARQRHHSARAHHSGGQ